MSDKKIKMALVIGLISIYIAVSYSVSAIVIMFLSAALFVPPAVVFLYVLKEGIPLVSGEFRNLFNSGTGIFVISVSKEHIILEPEYR
ncbi:MAG: hypothetical protein OIN89_05410 [Candidatus Methanoperedens sp.]|jgi:hypothetical protein|nr:hypothetical protein [Candidatus Methanoperedens sp.]PKL53916.1 MAG: hypothetical protein CVV36_04535 [Candidatus Methanoperedenaceae archaeon HGW-Methanoperedenaceae-1]